MNIYAISFTKKNAEDFFGFLGAEKIKTLIDVRLNNVSRLAGFAKRDDLKFLLKELVGMEYEYMPDLAPTKDIFWMLIRKVICLGKYMKINFLI